MIVSSISKPDMCLTLPSSISLQKTSEQQERYIKQTIEEFLHNSGTSVSCLKLLTLIYLAEKSVEEAFKLIKILFKKIDNDHTLYLFEYLNKLVQDSL